LLIFSLASVASVSALAANRAGVGIVWYDKDKQTLGVTTTQLPAISGSLAWQEVVLERAVPPAGARYAAAGPVVMQAAASQTLGVYFSNVIFRRSIGSAYIEDLKAGQITTGVLDVGTVIGVGPGMTIHGGDGAIYVYDQQTTPQLRVRLGRLGFNPQDYGLEILDQNGNAIVTANGLGLEVVGTTNIGLGAVTGEKFVVEEDSVWVSKGGAEVTLISGVLNYTGFGQGVEVFFDMDFEGMYQWWSVGGRDLNGYKFAVNVYRNDVLVKKWTVLTASPEIPGVQDFERSFYDLGVPVGPQTYRIGVQNLSGGAGGRSGTVSRRILRLREMKR